MVSTPRSSFYLFRLIIAVAVVCVAIASSGQSPASTAQRNPVLVELFTSEGCSDCPPADALLARLDSTQFIPGAQAIVLSEHVTYWNHLGWSDPFSFQQMDQRQQQYGSHFALDSIYTPQMVIDGAEQVVGNSTAAVSNAVAHAVSSPKVALVVNDAHWDKNNIRFSVRGDLAKNTSLFTALAEDATHSEVSRGENAGRTLHHVAVVREFKEFGPDSLDGRSLQLSAVSLSHDNKAAGPVRLVVFVADRKSGHVTAVAQQTIPR